MREKSHVKGHIGEGQRNPEHYPTQINYIEDIEEVASEDIQNIQEQIDSVISALNNVQSTVNSALQLAQTLQNSANVTGVKGSAESSYRTGNVNITAANIGLGNVNNTADSAKSVNYANSAGTCTGNAATATKATQDGNGNNIVNTYLTKTGKAASATSADTAAACTGNAATATTATKANQLTTARNIQTNLASTAAASFNGTANVTPGVTGVLPIANGGTGRTDGRADPKIIPLANINLRELNMNGFYAIRYANNGSVSYGNDLLGLVLSYTDSGGSRKFHIAMDIGHNTPDLYVGNLNSLNSKWYKVTIT